MAVGLCDGAAAANGRADADDLGWTLPAVTPVPEPSTPPQKESPPSPLERVFPYEPGGEYKFEVAVDVPLHVMLHPDETVRELIGGDRRPGPAGEEGSPWHVQGTEGSADIFLVVDRPGLSTGITLTTSARPRYYLVARSVAKTKVRVVRWRYADEPRPTPPREVPWPNVAQPQAYHMGYRLEATEPRPVWLPRQIVDDGRKTYILLPRNLAAMPAPMLRLIGPNGPELVNARQIDSLLIVDYLFNQAELRVGTGPTAEMVRITRDVPQTIRCPGDDACPVWPAFVQSGP